MIKIKKLPIEIQQLVFKNQIEAGNQPNDSLELDDDNSTGNFFWRDSEQGYDFWYLISIGDYSVFYDSKYDNPDCNPPLPQSVKENLISFLEELSALKIEGHAN